MHPAHAPTFGRICGSDRPLTCHPAAAQEEVGQLLERGEGSRAPQGDLAVGSSI
jgi:hypothetical protein